MYPEMAQRAQVYLTATDVLGRRIAADERDALWSGVTVDQALNLLAQMLRDVDKVVTGPEESERRQLGWAGALTSPLREQVLTVLSRRRPLLAPQILLLAICEALEKCPDGPPRDDLVGLDDVMMAVLGIAGLDETDESSSDSPTRRSFELSVEIAANANFNKSTEVAHLVTESDFMWRREWPSTVPAKVRSRLGLSPAAMFAQSVGAEYDEFLAATLHLWTQAEIHGFVRFPEHFFGAIEVSPAAVRAFLDRAGSDVETLRTSIAEERIGSRTPEWAFNTLRQFPLLRLSDGTWLILRLAYIVQRTLGATVRFDVLTDLETADQQRAGDFRSALTYVFEETVAKTASRIFERDGLARRVFRETEAQRAWKGPRGRTPQVCDVLVDCGSVWLLLECTARRLPAHLVNGTATEEQLYDELDLVLTDRKAKQLASTGRLIRHDLQRLTGRLPPPGLRIVPLVIVPDEGLGWNEFMHLRTQDRLKTDPTLTNTSSLSPAVLSLRELRFFEALLETGEASADLLVQWRVDAPWLPLDHFIKANGLPLKRPAHETEVFSRVVDDVILSRYEDAGTPGDTADQI